eukprot:GGOE01044687.1.p2 GENE.GGOE01044687.1~~GGOE01044687.1.p2  ORF type:complete len:373 (+),score=111.60 GGOE01044687.1:57-1121(+)
MTNKWVEAPGGLLLATRVFGRMSPEHKVRCVELHMALGLTVGMCGDGGNDAGALRTAHVGIAFSDSDAAMVSPFTSTDGTVMSVVDVIREGRCALCTSFSVVKYQIMYGLILSVIKLVACALQVVLGVWMWIYMDCFVSLVVAATLTLARPEAGLAPSQPTASLLAPLHVGTALAQLAVHGLTTLVVVGWLRTRSFYVAFDPAGLDALEWWKFTHNYEATVFFALICLQVLGTGVSYSLGGVYRRSPLRSPSMVLLWLLVMAVIAAILIPDTWWLADTFEIASSPQVIRPCDAEEECVDDCLHRPHELMPQWFRVALMGVCAVNMVVVIGLEKLALAASVSLMFTRPSRLQVRP